MLVDLAYGREGLRAELPDGATVVRPAHHPAEAAPAELVARALAAPLGAPRLRDLVHRGDTVALAVCDGTRPQPRALVVEALLAELAGVVDDDDVVVLVATGTHRANTEAELEAMLSPELVRRLEVVNHDALDDDRLARLPRAGDVEPVACNRRFLEADVRITTGVVEPHFFAGFSGGPKLVAPGLAGMDTILALHDARRIGDPRATFGVLEGNPVHEGVRAVAREIGVTFSCDVVLDAAQRPVACFAGELFAVHDAACAMARTAAMAGVEGRFDVVVTTNAGHPLDQNLYQAVKGMAAAAQVVRPGGLIVLAARCEDGFPDHGGYRRLLTGASSPADLLAQIARREKTAVDQWQVQVQARVQSLARVAVHTEGIEPGALEEAHLEPAADLGAAVADELRRAGRGARVCVLPEGPRTIPYVVDEAAPPG